MRSPFIKLAYFVLAIASGVSGLVAWRYGYQDDARYFGIVTMLFTLLSRD